MKELQKQCTELQDLNPQSAEEAQKQSETMKDLASQIKSSTKNIIDSEKLSIFLFTPSFFLIFDI